MFGLIALPTQAAYNATKFAVRGFTETLRQELRRSHINVTCVMPGSIRTNIIRNARVPARPPFNVGREELSQQFDNFTHTSAEQAARKIIDGVEKNKVNVLVGEGAHFLSWLARLMPVKYPSILRWWVRLSRKSTKGLPKHQTAKPCAETHNNPNQPPLATQANDALAPFEDDPTAVADNKTVA